MQVLEPTESAERCSSRGKKWWFALIIPYALSERQRRFNAAFNDACMAGNLATCRALVHAHGHVDPQCGGVILSRVVNSRGPKKKASVVKWLVRECGVDVHTHQDFPFQHACDSEQWKVARVLLALDPDYAAWPAAAMNHLRARSCSKARKTWMRAVVRRPVKPRSGTM
jgi:hypothetical protein